MVVPKARLSPSGVNLPDAGGDQDLASVLAVGNETGGNDVAVSTGDAIAGETALPLTSKDATLSLIVLEPDAGTGSAGIVLQVNSPSTAGIALQAPGPSTNFCSSFQVACHTADADGGDAVINAGAGGFAGPGNGGEARIVAGVSTNGGGGDAVMRGGEGSTAGGNLLLRAGNAQTSGKGGNAAFLGGDGIAGAGGNLQLGGGTANAAAGARGGEALLRGGDNLDTGVGALAGGAIVRSGRGGSSPGFVDIYGAANDEDTGAAVFSAPVSVRTEEALSGSSGSAQLTTGGALSASGPISIQSGQTSGDGSAAGGVYIEGGSAGGAGSTGGNVDLVAGSGATSGRVRFSVAGGTVFTLPETDGAPGDVLSTDGSGNLSWITP